MLTPRVESSMLVCVSTILKARCFQAIGVTNITQPAAPPPYYLAIRRGTLPCGGANTVLWVPPGALAEKPPPPPPHCDDT